MQPLRTGLLHDSMSVQSHFKRGKRNCCQSISNPQTFPSLTVAKSVGVGNHFGSKDGFEQDYVDYILEFTNLADKKDAMAGQLNLLDKKMLMIGAALATKPEILMLDEPMAGSNAKEILKLMDLIQRINRELKVTIIIIEHFMKVLTELTEKLLIIETGTEICCGDPVEVTSDSRVIECYLGDSHD